MSSADLDLAGLVIGIMREAAGAEIVPRFMRRDLMLRTKTHARDFSTDADQAAERAIVDRLRAIFPDALFVGEEADWTSPHQRRSLLEADLAFVIDPLDGTANFVAGLPLFAVIVAVVRNGRPFAGAILDPVSNEVMYAAAGQGAWRQEGGGQPERLLVSQHRSLENARGAGFGLDVAPSRRAEIFGRLAALTLPSILHCSGHEYRLLASGHCDYLLHISDALKPWDHAAGLLMYREAGGYAASLDGNEWSGLGPANSILCATSRDLWEQVRAALGLDALFAPG